MISEQEKCAFFKRRMFFWDDCIPLHRACDEGHPVLVETLIDAGADIEAEEEDGDTSMHRACRAKRLAAAETLIRKGANVNAKNRDNWTPLHVACVKGSVDMVRTLIHNGADIEALDKAGANVFACGANGYMAPSMRGPRHEQGMWELHVQWWREHPLDRDDIWRLESAEHCQGHPPEALISLLQTTIVADMYASDSDVQLPEAAPTFVIKWSYALALCQQTPPSRVQPFSTAWM
eukprot:TRINITY_DN12416_c4_g3_i6.p1 TRINITY_DN12416_c4_g3~~TRINITY_DN12416_c4_g3_i6.p1  ORF type:complete len:235 (+),score=28.13 TRINITY_DN12416_c4_g3_i6:200-904(+)